MAAARCEPTLTAADCTAARRTRCRPSAAPWLPPWPVAHHRSSTRHRGGASSAHATRRRDVTRRRSTSTRVDRMCRNASAPRERSRLPPECRGRRGYPCAQIPGFLAARLRRASRPVSSETNIKKVENFSSSEERLQFIFFHQGFVSPLMILTPTCTRMALRLAIEACNNRIQGDVWCSEKCCGLRKTLQI